MNSKQFVLKSYVLLFQWHSKLKDFGFDNILIDEKLHKNILIYIILYKTLIGTKPLRVRFDKIEGFIRIYDGTRYLVSLCLKNMMLFTLELVYISISRSI